MFYKTIVIPVKCSKNDLNYLFNCNRLSAEVWNKCVELDNRHKEITGKQIKMTELQKATKNMNPLHSKGIQHVAHKYINSRNAMWESIKAKHKNKTDDKINLPYRTKKYFTTGWDYQSIRVDYEKGIIKLSRCKTTNKQPKPVICYAKTIPENIVQIELIYRHRLLLAIKYKIKDNYTKINSSNGASIDLGEIHSITSIDNNGNAIIITGRKIRSDKRLRNKEQGKIRKRMSRCTKDSKQYKKYRRALNNLSKRFDRKELDAIHKITKLYVNYCIQRDIKIVYYGDLDRCTRNTKGKLSKKVSQKINEWNYGLLMRQLENKLSRYDVELIEINEAYSSRKCPNCGKLNKPNNRNYICKHCDYTQHRDVVGAINILNMNSSYHITKYNNLKYLQIA